VVEVVGAPVVGAPVVGAPVVDVLVVEAVVDVDPVVVGPGGRVGSVEPGWRRP